MSRIAHGGATPPVHPHTCGEHLRSTGPDPDVRRFIPTPVGNIIVHCPYRAPIAVHPHTCGEHGLLIQENLEQIGSSPHLWGTCVCPGSRRIERRFIPTPVGNIPNVFKRFVAISVHPHTCGEHGLLIQENLEQIGSSPHLWGTCVCPGSRRIERRFIPTPVGNIPNVFKRFVAISVHPHTCGEHSQADKDAATITGSSPHLWGTCDKPRDLY